MFLGIFIALNGFFCVSVSVHLIGRFSMLAPKEHVGSLCPGALQCVHRAAFVSSSILRRLANFGNRSLCDPYFYSNGIGCREV